MHALQYSKWKQASVHRNARFSTILAYIRSINEGFWLWCFRKLHFMRVQGNSFVCVTTAGFVENTNQPRCWKYQQGGCAEVKSPLFITSLWCNDFTVPYVQDLNVFYNEGKKTVSEYLVRATYGCCLQVKAKPASAGSVRANFTSKVQIGRNESRSWK